MACYVALYCISLWARVCYLGPPFFVLKLINLVIVLGQSNCSGRCRGRCHYRCFAAAKQSDSVHRPHDCRNYFPADGLIHLYPDAGFATVVGGYYHVLRVESADSAACLVTRWGTFHSQQVINLPMA
jgi:hypothetical protein